MLIKAQCEHCRADFEDEGLEKTVFCPHCGKETRLYQSDNRHSKPAKTGGMIENTLDGLGILFFILGIIGLVIGGVIFVGMMHPGEEDSPVIPLAFAIGSFFQGCILWTLFAALAEIIRLLRAIAGK